MALVNPNNKDTKEFDPNVDNANIAANAHSGGKIITYISFILIIPLILYIVKRNDLIRLQMKINEAASGIDVQLKKRKDTLVKLVDAAKGSMKFEKETIKQVTQLRSGKVKGNEKVMALTDQIASSINVSVEAYPDIKSVKNISKLMDASTDIELEIAASRRLYNSYVNRFNTGIFTWPGSVAATAMQLSKLPLYATSVEDKKDVSLNLND